MRKLLFYVLGAGLLIVGLQKYSHRLFENDLFSAYPVGQTFTVNFDFPDLAVEEFTDREKADQARDWMLFTLLTHGGLQRQQVAQASFDLAPVRYGYNATLANFEFGETRSKFIGNGRVLALVPASDKATWHDHVAHIVDEIRMSQGEKPQKVYVFEYDLNTEGQFARVTRRENIRAADYFTEEAGYFEMPVGDLGAFQSFMDRIDDITYAAKHDGELMLGGRKMRSRAYGRATSEDVAAIWQSEQYIEQHQQMRDNDFDNLNSAYQLEQNEIINRYETLIKSLKFTDGSRFSTLYESEQNAIISFVGKSIGSATTGSGSYFSTHLDDPNLHALVAKMKAELDEVTARYEGKAARMNEDPGAAAVASASGFSLDPAVDFEKSIAFVRENRIWFQLALEPDYTVDQLISNLQRRQGDLMFYAIARIGSSFGALVGVEERARQACLYQKARYDGKLQGTQVGMTLFYTDLLAKIWAGNRFYSKPIDFIVGFKDHEQSKIGSVRVFERESQALPAVRLWFGPNKSGFQAGRNKEELTFARNATQIFALSNDPGAREGMDAAGNSKKLEAQASAEFDIALSWWNNHYEEVASYEPQYERLNEIMKWSTIISWLNEENSGSLLRFLGDLPVDRTQWFPDWARAKADLKFSQWDKVGFYPRNHLGDQTEGLPILFSPHKLIFGGVSLAEKSLIREAPELLSAEKAFVRRANLLEEGENAFRTFKDTKVSLTDDIKAKVSRIDLAPQQGYKLRNRYGEVANSNFEWQLAEESGGTFSLRSRMGETPIGELRTASAGRNGFSVGFESLSADKGMALARQMSDYKGNPGAFLAEHPQVSRYFQAESGEWCMQLKNADDWIVMRVDAEPTIDLAPGWQHRTSGSQLNSKIVEVKWVTEGDVRPLARSGKFPENVRLDNPLDETPDMITRRLVESKGESGAAAELKQLQERGLAEADELAASGQFEKAAAQMDRVIRHFGETAERATKRIRFQLEAGLKAYDNGNINSAANYFNKALTRRSALGESADFLGEVNRMIDNATLPGEVKSQLHTLSEMYLTDRQLIAAGYWEGYKSVAKPVVLDQLSSRNARVIYSDQAAFNHIDPAAPFETVVEQLRSIPGVQVYDISAEAIGRNTRLYATVEPKFGASLYDVPTQELRLRVIPGSRAGNCLDRDNDGRCDEQYSVPGPVYFVTAASDN
jgi:hypothetical protein